jgi:sigma-B regulation protein RsbU (phosphoserine phosphatase)
MKRTLKHNTRLSKSRLSDRTFTMDYMHIKKDLQDKIAAMLQIQIEVFHYKKALILVIDNNGLWQVLLQSDKKSYGTFLCPLAKTISKKLILTRKDLTASKSALKPLFEFFNFQLLVPISTEKNYRMFMALASAARSFNSQQTDLARFIANSISNMIMNENLVHNLENYSDRMERMLKEMGTLHEITHALESTANLDSLLEYIMKKSQAVMQAQAASLMLVVEGSNELEFKIALGPKATGVKPFRLPIGKGISGWVAQTGEAVLIADAYSDARFDPSFDQRSGFMTKSMLVVPMIHKSKTIGVMSVLNRFDGLPFNESDKMLFTIFASQAALVIENARLLYSAIEKERLDKELQVAAEIQRSLIPQQMPDLPFLDIAAAYLPCKEVGGDFYDFMQLDENRFIFIIADVSGKGIPGAMVVSNMQATLRGLLQYSSDLLSVVKRLNETIIRTTIAGRFITFFIGLYDHQQSTITFVNAGHNPPLIIDERDNIKELSTGGIFIGFTPWEYQSETVPFKQGHTFVMYTDGLVESMNEREEEFGLDALKKIITSSRHNGSATLKDEIIRQVKNHIGTKPLEDDFTLMISRRV